MDTAFAQLVAVCERMRHLTGALETIRNLLMADVMADSEDTRSAMGDTQQTARGLFIHALGLRQRTGHALQAAIQHIGGLDGTEHAERAAEWLKLCRELAGSLQGIDAVLAELDRHFQR